MRLAHLFAAVVTAIGHAAMAGANGYGQTPETPVEFNRDIRPILADRCFQCHGPDANKREADLRLDTFTGATRDLGGHAAIVPGDATQSELIRRIESTDAHEQMPPPEAKKPALTAAEVVALRQWIESGAKYQPHWALRPLANPTPPAVANSDWPINPIDQFILAKLESHNLQPSPEADRYTLIRRVSLDLTGLLPDPAEVTAFVADDQPDAYERLVDRLLASPHYGERWGRHWLDQARYADSHGYSIDGEREMWPYRDWVIHALNSDMPFDQFTIEQLAGDLLPNPTKMQLVATGFHRNTLINQEGGSDPEQFRVESVMDRVNTTGAVWLGLTVGCAQCHSHKYDEISHREYYQLLAFFNSTHDANNVGPTFNVAQNEVFQQSLNHAHLAKRDATDPQPSDPAKWELAEQRRLKAALRGIPKATKWTTAEIVEVQAESAAGLSVLDDGSILTSPDIAGNETIRIRATSQLSRIRAIRLRALTHPSLPNGGPGRASNGNFILSNFTTNVDQRPLRFQQAFADHSQVNYPVAAAIDNDPTTGWAINVQPGDSASLNADHAAIFVLADPLEPNGTPLELVLSHQVGQGYVVGRFAIDLSESLPAHWRTHAERLLTILAKPQDKRTSDEQKILSEAYPTFGQPPSPTVTASGTSAATMIMQELTPPRDTFVFTRGDFTRPDREMGKIQPGVLRAIAPKLPSHVKRASRLDLARWLVSPRNPLTPRVTVNRMWMRYFGRGLVETENDFGVQGAPPSHPELLDWLGREFIRNNWSQKAIHRLIVTSATYRQASHAREELAEIDPRNLLLARQTRLRLEGEIIRDAALCASGQLNRTVGGPSVKPPQPDGVYSFTQVPKQWAVATDGNRYRRGMYTFFYRSVPYPLLTLFDSPDFQTTCTSRNRSNTPLQSLALANDEAFLELARFMALRLIREVPGEFDTTLPSRIERAFMLTVCRRPTTPEINYLTEYVHRQIASFSANPSSASQLLGNLSLQDPSPAQGSALVYACRTLMNTDNFVTRE